MQENISDQVPLLPDYIGLREILPIERKAIMRLHDLEESDEDLVRPVEDARTILSMLEKVQSHLHETFLVHPSLQSLFKKEFQEFSVFIDRTTVLEICFLYDCLFPEKEMYYFGQDGQLSSDILGLIEESLGNWSSRAREDHEVTQERLKESFSLSLKVEDLSCQCSKCQTDYRAKFREKVFEEASELIQDTSRKILVRIEDISFDEVNHLYHEMQRQLEKQVYKVRNKLKRSSINRLETQIKAYTREVFNYPSELAQKQVAKLKVYFDGILHEDGVDRQLITEEEMDRFFHQISSNIWRGERYLQREFRKFVKSIMLLKRTDISAEILKEYLGEFWVHSQARQIKRKIVYHKGPTNSGKTYHAIQKLASAGTGCYLAPLRLLAGELYDTLTEMGVKTTLLTGEEIVEVEDATHYSSTIEMARFQEIFDCCVIDEIQMINDPQRGWAWTRALVNIFADEVHVCGDPSVENLLRIIVDLCGDELEIRDYERMTKLIIQDSPITLGELERGDALIVFSRRSALRYKSDLERLGFKVSIVYGRLGPEVRREQARKFDHGETDIIVSTDAISMGMNLPIKRIVFSTLVKHIDNQEFPISISEIKQIAGRAGRYKRFPVGHVTCLTKARDGIDEIQMALAADIEQKKECMVGPDLDIFNQVNQALRGHNLPQLKLSEFLRLFNTMTFKRPFFCVDLKEMIELAETVEEADPQSHLSDPEIFGFACAPVNLGLQEHVQYYIWILGNYVNERSIPNDRINYQSDDIEYLETAIKCVELYQWLARHFNNKNFYFNQEELLENKIQAVEKLNQLLSQKTVRKCSSCGVNLGDDFQFPICEKCFKQRRHGGRRHAPDRREARPGEGRSGEKRSGPGKFSDKKKFARKKFRPKRKNKF